MQSNAVVSFGYQPDIDGLRAVAVLSVVLYHIDSGWVPGGFVGVDIFFVISGFLITRNIWGPLQAGKFSLADFYLRRIRRIAPALLVVMASTMLAGMLLLLPSDLVRLASSAVWAAFSAANIYYWKYLDTDYFAAAAAEEPMLHLWSLGVEEQFYLLWPAMLMVLAMARRPKLVTVAVTIIICAGSFTIAEMTNVSRHEFSYYMLPARAGELMLGAILAFCAVPGYTAPRYAVWRERLAETLAAGGSALIVFSLWWVDDDAPFPGINALYPCLGTVLLIASGQMGSRLTGMLLTPRPIVYLGLISYSLYLWHWPILAFIRYFYGEVSPPRALAASVLILALSAASYRFVEKPARRMTGPSWQQVSLIFVAPVLTISVAAMVLIGSDGMRATIESTHEFKAAATTLNRQTSASNRAKFPCADSRSSLSETLRDSRCVLGIRRTGPTVFLWGDSNAAHYIGALNAVAKHERFAFRYATLSTCPPVLGMGKFGSPRMQGRCDLFRAGIRKYLADGNVHTVVLAAQWSVHDRNPRFKEALDHTLAELKKTGKMVVLLGQVPWFKGYSRECEQRWARLGRGDCGTRFSVQHLPPVRINDYLASLALNDNSISYLDIDRVLCAEGNCSPYVDGTPVYYNPTHLSAAGSFRVGEKALKSVHSEMWSAAFQSAVPQKGAAYIAGYQPGFPHRVRSQRHKAVVAGQYQHVVIAEYLHVDDKTVVEGMISDLEKEKFAVEGPIKNQDAIRYVASRDAVTLTIDIHAQPSLPLVAEGARGIISFAWRDGQRW